jgi:hypothetical protein
MSIIKKTNFQYTIGEIILIFLGISLALSFDTWNDNRLLALEERGTLIEIREGIKKNLLDIQVNIAGHSGRNEECKSLIKHIEKNLPASLNINIDFAFLSGSTS